MGKTFFTFYRGTRRSIMLWMAPLWIATGLAIPVQQATAMAWQSNHALHLKAQKTKPSKEDTRVHQAEPVIAFQGQSAPVGQPCGLPPQPVQAPRPARVEQSSSSNLVQASPLCSGFYGRCEEGSICPNAP